MKTSIIKRGAGDQRCALALVPVFSGGKLGSSASLLDAATGGQLTKAIGGSAFEAKSGQTLTVHAPSSGPADCIVLAGVGDEGEVSGPSFAKTLRAGMAVAAANKSSNVASYMAEVTLCDRDGAWALSQSVQAAGAAIYRFDQCKSKNTGAPSLKRLRLGAPGDCSAAQAQAAATEGEALAAGLAYAKDLGNLPGNICTPSYLAQRARELAKQHDAIKTKVLSENDMKRLGMGSLLSVCAGSPEPAKLICMEYRGGPTGQAPTALVGKGVTFDTGGISLKPGAAMDEMKFDMCGAASVFGSLVAAAMMKLPLNVVGIVPATENMPGGQATKPGDIVTAMDGQTIEILNTDAEGRLILCDALTYARRFDPESVVDIATLTGACVVALGAPASGLFSNDQDLADGLLTSGQHTGDRAWQMPVWDEYDEMLKSNFADMANIGGREAGAVTAACFLARFAKGLRWAHLDIAGSAWLKGRAKGSTGRPVPLLVEFLKGRVRSD